MLNFNFLEKGLGIVSPLHFACDYPRKMFLLHSVDWPHSLPECLDILRYWTIHFLWWRILIRKWATKTQKLKQMLRKSPARFKNTDFSWSPLKVTKLSKCLYYFLFKFFLHYYKTDVSCDIGYSVNIYISKWCLLLVLNLTK